MEWESLRCGSTVYFGLRARQCFITLEPRARWCDRGNWIARLDSVGLFIDDADGWPRYYFDFERAKLECEAWIMKRRLWTDDPAKAMAFPPFFYEP